MVIAIVAILAAIAIPGYQSSVEKSRRTDAKAALTEIAALQEKHFFKDNQYSSDISEIYGGAVSKEGFYTLSLTVASGDTGCGEDGECFIATATAPSTSPQYADDLCRTFTLNYAGQQKAANSGGTDTSGDCW